MRPMLLSLMGLALAGCGPADSPDAGNGTDAGPAEPGLVALHFEHLIQGATMVLDEGASLQDGSPLTFTKMRYWISNVVLLGDSVEDHTVADSYYLVEQTSENTRLQVDLQAVPAARYRGIRFSVGVDEPRNHSLDTLAGELDATVNMSWNWNTGFIFLKAEGAVGLNAQGFEKSFSFHIGGDTNYRVIQLDLEEAVEVSADGPIELHLKAELTRFFDELNRDGNLSILGGNLAERVASNYGGMWSLETGP